MDGPRSGGGDELRRFRRLAVLTALTTFALTILGGIVRVSESGLGCGPGGSGTEGWPLCGGEAIPLLDNTEVVIEFSHRLLAAVVVAMIALLAWRALKIRRGENGTEGPRWPLRGSIAAGLLVLFQAGLGGLTVEKNLEDELVAAHLGAAMILLGLLLWLAMRAGDAEEAEPERPVRGLKPFAGAAAVLLLCAIIAGGYVAGTEEEGVTGGAANGAHLACGERFPTCLEGDRVLPFGESRLTDIHLTHRVFVYLATAAILFLLGLAFARGSRSPLLALAAGLLVSQVLLGALNVWLGEHATLVVLHLAVATLLWSTILAIAYRLAWAPAVGRVREGAAGGKPSAATA